MSLVTSDHYSLHASYEDSSLNFDEVGSRCHSTDTLPACSSFSGKTVEIDLRCDVDALGCSSHQEVDLWWVR